MELNQITVQKSDPLLLALRRMDRENVKLLLVLDQDRFCGLLSIGDVQRYIIKSGGLDGCVSDASRSNVRTASLSDDIFSIKEVMLKNRIEYMPVLDDNGSVVRVIFWDNLFENAPSEKERFLESVPVVIMAGGKGTRLRPITNIIPKPLIPLGELSTIERIINQFHVEGARKFFATVNYKAEMIRFYFSELELDYSIEFLEEGLPLGTGGSLFLLKNKIDSTFFITNCDILLDEKMSKVYEYHKNNKNDVTIVSAVHDYAIPYGTMETGAGGVLLSMQEKPELVYQVNTGVYVFEPKMLDRVPVNQFIHITDLIMEAKRDGLKVGVFPVSSGAWMDIGQWTEYRKTAFRFGDTFE